MADLSITIDHLHVAIDRVAASAAAVHEANLDHAQAAADAVAAAPDTDHTPTSGE